MNIEYLIKLWKKSNYNKIMIKDLPLARDSDSVVVEPTLIINKNEKISFGKEMNAYEYLEKMFKNCIFEYIKDEEMLIAKVIYKKNVFIKEKNK
jgi:hypothetical protein